MAKKEKIVSFDTMNRKEYITDTVTGIMVAGILMCVLRGILHFPITWISAALDGDGWQFHIRTLATTILSAVGITLPLYIYGLAVDSKVKKVFKRRSDMVPTQKIMYGIMGAVAAIAAAILCLKLSFVIMDAAEAAGYVFTVNAPDTGSNGWQNLFFILVNSLIPALLCEPFYRGVVMGRLSRDSYLLAVLVPAIIFAANHPNIPQMPYMFVVGIILGYIYLKTEDIIVPTVIHALVNGVIGYFYVKAGSAGAFTLSDTNLFIIMGLFLIIAGIMIIFIGSPGKKHPPEDKPFSIRESLKGLFGTFWIYALIIVVLFQLGQWHIDNPTFGLEEDEPAQEEIQDEDSSSDQEIE